MRRRFDLLRDWLWALLPGQLGHFIPATAIGYVLINSFTFSVDIALMTVLFRVVGLPYPVSVSLGFLVAFALAYVLNRALNFESHGAVGRELIRYGLVVAVNYFGLVVGLSTALKSTGMHFQVARVTAACVEAVFMYCSLRWFVFRRTGASPVETDVAAPATLP